MGEVEDAVRDEIFFTADKTNTGVNNNMEGGSTHFKSRT